MKRLLLFVLLAGLAFAAGALVAGRQQAALHARELEIRRASWEAEKAGLEAALAHARTENTDAAEPAAIIASPAAVSAPDPDPEALLNQLAALKITSSQGRAMRQVLVLLEHLAQIGPASLPAIGKFLASGQDTAYSPIGGKGMRDLKSITDALGPLSLRFALFDVVRQIGGADAEKLLAETLGRTARGIELAYLAQVLEELAPGKYKEYALATARNLLAGGGVPDRTERDYLFSVLQQFNDTTYVATAQAQLVQPGGQVDRGALRYLQQTLGTRSVAIAAQTYRDARVTEADSKEPLARVALAYVGADDQALDLYHTAVLDPALKPDQRRELVEDLNQDGLSSKKMPTPEDLKMIANRYALTQAYLQQDYVQNDKVLNAAFREADKDLRNMLQKASAAANPAPASGQ